MAWRPARAWTSQRPVAGYRHFELITQGALATGQSLRLQPLLVLPKQNENL